MFLALYLISNLLLRSFTDIWLFIGWASLCSGIILAGCSKGPARALYALILLLVFHALAIPGSILWGSGNWELTAGVLLWMAPALLLYLAKDAEKVFLWLVPAFFIHAAWVMAQVSSPGINTGMANNPNLAAGFLIIGIIYMMSSGRTWWALPLLAALIFTESRWGMVVVGVLLPAMGVAGVMTWRPLFFALVSVIGSIMLFGTFGPSGYGIGGHGTLTSLWEAIPTDIGVRLAVPHIPSFLPSGVAEHPGLHNVPLRIAVESGILAAGIWILITGWALVTPRLNNRSNDDHDHCWILLALVLLSVLDYYTWMGHLGGFWWLLIGLLLKPSDQRIRHDIVQVPTSDTPPLFIAKHPVKAPTLTVRAEQELSDV